jgi:type IV pilus assembly protein PilE
MTMKPLGKGFSLLELMIALGVAAIVAMFAIPSYRMHVAKAHRLDAVAALMRAVQFVETARLTRLPGAGASGESVALPAGLDRTPSAGAAIYALAVLPESATNGGYTIEAAPIASGAMQDDACGIFAIDATGVRSNRTNANAPLEAAQSASCWAGKG